MKSINTYYVNQEQLKLFISDRKITNSSSLLIQVFSSIIEKSFISKLLSELKEYLPDAVIIGTSTDGEIMNGKVTSGKVVLSFTQFDHTTLKAAAIEHKANGFYSGQYLANELVGDDTKLLISFVDGLNTNGEEFLNGISSISDDVVVTGGHAGDNGKFEETMVFTKEKIMTHGAVAVSLNSTQLQVYTDYSFNWHPIGNELTITKAEGNRIYTIDGRSAVDTYAYYLGERIAEGLPTIGVEFPLIVNRNGANVSRASIGKNDDGSIIVAGNLYTGEKVRIGYGNSKDILQKSQLIAESLAKRPSETIFIYSCSTRKYFMGEEVESETLPLQQFAPVSGFFTYGEFFTSNKKELFNQTMTFVALSESAHIEKIVDHNEAVELESDNMSVEGLTHLLSMTSKEIQEEEEIFRRTQEHKERMELALIGTNEGVWDWNIIENSVYFSPRWKEMIGYRDDELPNEVATWADRIHPEDADKAWEDVYKNVNGETEFYENIHRLKHKDGHWVWILDRGKTQYDENGKAIRMIGTHVDITQAKKNQVAHSSTTQTNNEINIASINGLTHLINITYEQVKEQSKTLIESQKLRQQLQERMELALEGSKTSVLDWDFTDNSLYISPSWKEMLGFKDDELPNKTSSWFSRAHRDDKKKVLKLIREHEMDQKKYFEFNHRLKHKNGYWVQVLGRAQMFYDENGKKIRMVGTQVDITEEKKLQLKYFYQAQIIEQIHDSLVTTDLKGNITSWNLGSEKIFGYTQEEAVGQNISMLYREEDRVSLKEYIPILMKYEVLSKDMYLVKKSKELIPISFSLTLLRDEKGNPTGIVGINKDNTKRKKVEDELFEQKNILRHQALHDELTGLPNRALFKDRLAHGIISAQRHGTGLAIFFIDLDKFKQINDSLGHDVGDSVLKAVAKRLKKVIRKEDTLARLGGDEFTVIMDDLINPRDADILVNKILKILAEPLYIDDHILYVTGSIGISLYPEDADDPALLLKYADTAMYKAKEQGHNTFKFYSYSMTKLALEKMNMKTALQQAIVNKEFIIHYQPQIDTKTNKLIGIEALIRWEHPTKGLLYPDTFIPFAEETGMIIKIDKWVMKTAMKQVSKWYRAGLNPGVLSTNLSIRQLECEDFPFKVQRRLKKYDFDPNWLELEITEGQMMKRTEAVIRKLQQLNDLGINISIDDFGTGYSSLLLLKRLPINRLKIDRSFVIDTPEDEEDVAIIKAIIALAKSLKLNLIAEGVETKEQKEFLIHNGCTNIQGHYYSQPLSAKKMEKMLLSQHIW